MTWQLNNLFKYLLINFNPLAELSYTHNPHDQILYTHTAYSPTALWSLSQKIDSLKYIIMSCLQCFRELPQEIYISI